MKKYAIGLILLHYSFTYTDTRQEVFGRSFMFTRPAHFHLSTQQALWHNIMYTKKGPVFGALQIIGIYQQSSKIKKTARYFLINGKNKLVVSGDANIAERNTRDIRAEWLSLPDDFLGSFSLNPKQRQIAGILEYNQDLKRWFKDVKFLKDWWLSISAPIISVKNDLKLKQKIKRKGTPVVDGPQDIIEAFKQDAWCFSRIEGKKDKVGLAELRFTLGSKYIDQDYLQIGYYSIFIIPTAKKTRS